MHEPPRARSYTKESAGYALGDDEGDVVVLFAGAELTNFIYDGRQQVRRRQATVPLQRLGQALLSKFFSRRVEGFCDAVGVKSNRISAHETAFPDAAVPVFEESEHGAGGVQPFQSVIAAKHETGKVSAV